MTDREEILAGLPGSKGESIWLAPGEAIVARTVDERWIQFSEQLLAVGGKMIELNDLHSIAAGPVAVDEDAMPFVAGFDWLVTDDPWEADVGITMAQLAVAETGSLLLASGPDRRRLTSLAPSIHVCLVERQSIVQDLQTALSRLEPRNAVMITGSSRTADIEGVLVRGVHGPKEVWVMPY